MQKHQGSVLRCTGINLFFFYLSTTSLVFLTLSTHCHRRMFARCGSRLCWFSVFLWPSFGCVSCNPRIALLPSLSLFLALLLPYFPPVCMLIVSQSPLFLPNASPLHCTGHLQEVQCPLSVRGLFFQCHNQCAECQCHWSRWTGGSCLHSQNGQPQLTSRFTHANQSETAKSATTAMVTDKTPTYVIVVFSMLPVTVHDPSM